MRADFRALSRDEASFKRKSKRQKPRQTILIVCEDGKSSPAYFDDIRRRLRLATVDICGKECGSAPSNVVDYAVKEKRRREKGGSSVDIVFCVVDVDQHTTLDAARQKAKTHNLEFIVSSPCFERWYLLHFERGERPYLTYDSLVKHLGKYLPSYDKGTFSQFDAMWIRVETAIENARRLRTSRREDPRQNAFTDVDLVVEALRGLVA